MVVPLGLWIHRPQIRSSSAESGTCDGDDDGDTGSDAGGNYNGEG